MTEYFHEPQETRLFAKLPWAPRGDIKLSEEILEHAIPSRSNCLDFGDWQLKLFTRVLQYERDGLHLGPFEQVGEEPASLSFHFEAIMGSESTDCHLTIQNFEWSRR